MYDLEGGRGGGREVTGTEQNNGWQKLQNKLPFQLYMYLYKKSCFLHENELKMIFYRTLIR